MSAVLKKLLSSEEYLSHERQADFRHEFYRGEFFQMAGASREHNSIVFNLAASLGAQLRNGKCEGYANDMRAHIPAAGPFTYPDVAAACGEPLFLMMNSTHCSTL